MSNIDYARVTSLVVDIYQDAQGKWRWRLVASNNKIVGDSGQGYRTKWGCKRAARKFLGL